MCLVIPNNSDSSTLDSSSKSVPSTAMTTIKVKSLAAMIFFVASFLVLELIGLNRVAAGGEEVEFGTETRKIVATDMGETSNSRRLDTVNPKRLNTNYDRLKGCLRFKRHYNLYFPDDAEDHYRQLLNITARFRGVPIHSGGSFAGPWTENHFIDRFLDKPLEYFGGMFPLFVQWTDYQLRMRETIPDNQIFEGIRRFLRPNVLYVTVSQANHGLHYFAKFDPNVIVINGGGDGNIPIPLIKGELPYRPVPLTNFPSVDVGFYGSLDHGPRKYLLAEVKKYLDKHPQFRVKLGPSRTWVDDMANTSFNLAPRGFGRASFRLSEIVQLGRIPVYLYDDHPWMAYHGSNISVAAFGLVGRLGRLSEVFDQLTKMSPSEIEARLEKVKLARRAYTYEGVMDEIDAFFRDPLGPNGGHLRCFTIPSDLSTVLDVPMR